MRKGLTWFLTIVLLFPITGDGTYTFAAAGFVLDGADSIEAFLWDTMKPMCKPAVKSLG